MTLAIAVALAYLVAGILALCDRGIRIPGPSWFDIPHPTGRAARRHGEHP